MAGGIESLGGHHLERLKLTSFLSVLAPSLNMLILLRVLQGLLE